MYVSLNKKKLFNGPYGGAKPTTYIKIGNSEARVYWFQSPVLVLFEKHLFIGPYDGAKPTTYIKIRNQIQEFRD